MAQISYGTITVTDITDITDVYLQYALAIDSATVTNNYPFSQTGERGWNTTVPTWQSGYQIWKREVTIKEGINQPEYGTPYLDTAVNQLNIRISSSETNITALQTKLKRIWINEFTSGDYVAGTYAASGINGTTFIESNPQTYGYNTLLRHNALDLRYNTVKMTSLTTAALTFYIPTQDNSNNWIQGNKGLELSADGLKFFGFDNYIKSTDTVVNALKSYYTRSVNTPYTYTLVTTPTGNPSTNNYYELEVAAELISAGLKLIKGGIEAGTYSSSASDANQNFVYLSSEDYGTGIQIGNSPSDKTDWRQIIGNKFGVDKAGNLYASNATISGTITVGANSTIDAGATIGGTSASTVVSNAATGAQASSDLSNFQTTVANTYATQSALSDVEGQIPSDINELSDTDGIIPNDLSQLTDTTNIISSAVNTGVAGKADKTEATYRTQRIYYRSTEFISNVSTIINNTWLSTSGTGYGNWSLSVPQLTNAEEYTQSIDTEVDSTKDYYTRSSTEPYTYTLVTNPDSSGNPSTIPYYELQTDVPYPYLYTALQTQTITQYNNGTGTTCSCSIPVLDESTVVIDGGSIIANSIAANSLEIYNAEIGYIDSSVINVDEIILGPHQVTGLSEEMAAQEELSNYINAHMILDGSALTIQSGGNSKLVLDGSGLVLYGSDNNPLASYGTTAIIGNSNAFHIEIDGNAVNFYQDANTQLAYMNGSELKVENSLSFGHFIFYERSNGHFTLKLVD